MIYVKETSALLEAITEKGLSLAEATEIIKTYEPLSVTVTGDVEVKSPVRGAKKKAVKKVAKKK